MTRATIAFALLAIGCGFVGYSQVPLAPAEGLRATSAIGRFFDLLYVSLGMLGVGTRNTYGDPFLSVGRWFGVLFVFSAVLRALIPQASSALARRRIAWQRGHAVVIGLGARGRALAAGQREAGAVAGLDIADVERGTIGGPRTHPLLLLRGDATVARELARLNVERAARVFVCAGDDVRNHAIARTLIEAAASRRRDLAPLDLMVHVGDAELASTLLGELPVHDAIHLRPFSLPQMAARALLAQHGWLLGDDRVLGGPQRWLLLGWDACAEALVLQALRLGAGSTHGLPAITVLVDDPQGFERRLRLAYPAASELLGGLRFEAAGANGLADDEALAALEQGGRFTAIFVFGPSDAAAFALARRARQAGDRLGCWRVPTFVRLDDAAPWQSGLRSLARVKRLERVIESFGGLRETCSVQALGDWRERLAQQLHARWRASLPAGAVPRGRADRDWSALDEELRAANRRAVDHLPVKLAALGYVVRGARPVPPRAPSIAPAADRLLARLEHDSWCAEKRIAGWSHAAVRDDEHRRHDRLLPFDALPTAERSGAAPLLALLDVAAQGELAPPGAGAFRERVHVLHVASDAAGPAMDDAALRAAWDRWLAEAGASAACGAQGDAFWTFVVPLPGADARAVLQTLDAALRASCTDARGGRRYRMVAVRTRGDGAAPGPISEADERWLRDCEGCEAAIERAAEPAGALPPLLQADHVLAIRRGADGGWAVAEVADDSDSAAAAPAADADARTVA